MDPGFKLVVKNLFDEVTYFRPAILLKKDNGGFLRIFRRFPEHLLCITAEKCVETLWKRAVSAELQIIYSKFQLLIMAWDFTHGL